MTSVAVRLKMLRCFPVTQISEEERSELRLNRAINKQLKKEKKDFKNTFRLLLLGTLKNLNSASILLSYVLFYYLGTEIRNCVETKLCHSFSINSAYRGMSCIVETRVSQ